MIYVRDLKVGMTIPIERTKATISKITWMDGENGEPPMLIGGGDNKTAAAIRIEFADHQTIYAHPGKIVA